MLKFRLFNIYFKKTGYKFILTLSLFTFLAITACEDPKGAGAPVKNGVDYTKEPDQVSYGIEVAFVDSCYTKAILQAGRGRIYNLRNETLLDSGVYVQFFSKTTQKRISRLNSNLARVDDVTKNMYAKGKVVVISDSSGSKLESEELNWDNKTQKIYTNVYVKITTAYETVEGTGFESDAALTSYKVFKPNGIKR